MRTNIRKSIFVAFALIAMSACKDGDQPVPVQQELITTVKLVVTDMSGFNKTFAYKVENGFGTSSPGTVTKDDVVLQPNKEYNVEVFILNETKTPAENITEEVISESADHLFIYESNPAELLTFSNGSKDAANIPFNQRIVFTSGAAGNGELLVTLKHLPTNKAATKAADAGGETDVEASFVVKVQ